MKIHIQAICHKGLVRDNNEDAISIGGVFLRDDSMRLSVDVSDKGYFYLLVADGMGVHEKGEVASEIALNDHLVCQTPGLHQYENMSWYPLTQPQPLQSAVLFRFRY